MEGDMILCTEGTYASEALLATHWIFAMSGLDGH